MKKKELFVVFSIAIVLTTLGLVIDKDPKNESLWTTMFEYVMMLTLVFMLIVFFYKLAQSVFKKIKKQMV